MTMLTKTTIVLAGLFLVSAAACSSNETTTGGGTKFQHPVATFEVAGVETYKIELDTPALVEHAEQLLAGEEVAAIPNGKVVRDSPSVNAPWSWHIDPATLEFADFTAEVCDGLPSYVEADTVTSPYYCPWLTKLTQIEDDKGVRLAAEVDNKDGGGRQPDQTNLTTG